MQKTILITLILFCLLINWTTGKGGTIIDNAYYDPENNSIRYAETFYDGLGGSQVLHVLNKNEIRSVLIGIEHFNFEENKLMSVGSQLKEMFENDGFIALKEFKLNKTPIQIKLTLDYLLMRSKNELLDEVNEEHIKERILIPAGTYEHINYPKDYTISLEEFPGLKRVRLREEDYYIDNPKKNMIPEDIYIHAYSRINTIEIDNQILSSTYIYTCNLDPINFRGMGLENLDTIMIVASPVDKYCQTGGYRSEDVHIINGITIDPKHFLSKKSQKFNPHKYVSNKKLKPSKLESYIQPQIQGDNIIELLLETKKSGFGKKLKELIKKILNYSRSFYKKNSFNI